MSRSAPPPELPGLAPHALHAGFDRLASCVPPGKPSLWSALSPELLREMKRTDDAGPVEAPPPADPAPHVFPRHVERVDPTWLLVDAWRHPLSPRSLALPLLPPSKRREVCRSLGTRAPEVARPVTPVAAWAARHTWGHLVDMPPEGVPASVLAAEAPNPHALAAALPRLPASRLHDLVVSLGAPRLGALLAQVPRRAAAALAGRLPSPLREAAWVARGAQDAPGSPWRHDALQLLRTELADADPATLVFSLGARHLAAFLRELLPPARAQCAQLLPKPAGRLLLGEADRIPPRVEQIQTFFSY